MSIDITKMTVPQLQDLQAKIAEQIKTTQAQELSGMRAKIQEMADSLGVTVAELIGNTKNGNLKKPSGTVAIRYRNPNDASQTWTGRGREPNWVKNSGKTREELLIK